jgi:hypothetical protein
MNKLENKIIPVNKGLGDKSENLFIGSNAGGSTFGNNSKTTKGNIVEVETLDSFVEREKITVGLIKIDVEGFEQKLLQGALETIKSQRPSLLISIYHSCQDFFEIKPMIERLDLGYKFKIRKYAADNIFGETMLICEVL